MSSIKVIYPDFSDCIDRYRCVINGNDIIALGDNKKPILRKCLSFARRGFYTELWYTHSDGKSVLLNYWN